MFSRTLCGVNQMIRVFAKPQTIGCRLYSVCINQNMMKHQVVPDVISAPPRIIANIVYRSGAKVLQGNELKPRQVKDAPDVSWKYEPGAFYTLCMVDPDAPSRDKPQFREWHHWLVGNIPCDEVFKGEVLSAYIGSGPPKGTGLHRYVFLIYMQPKKLNFNEKRLPNNCEKGRKNFSINRFSKKYFLGDPVAGNFFQAQWDDYVPELYKQLGA